MSRRRGKHQRKRKRLKWPYSVLLTAVAVLIVGRIYLTFYRQDLLRSYISQFEEKKQVSSVETSSSSSKKVSELPAVSRGDWELLLVNRSHLREELNPQLTDVENIKVDSRIADATKQFLEAARKVAPEETLNSGYRSVAEQKELYDQTLAELEASGLSHEEAEREVQKQVQQPGASEHQTGLAIDMSVPSGQSDELAAQITAIAADYGFILRYPDGKSEITGIDFENWHYRYVGTESAKYMQKHNLVLEEYLQILQNEGR